MVSYASIQEFFVSLAETFYSERPFRKAAAGPGKSFLLLLLIVSILALPGFIRLSLLIHEVKREYVDATIYKLPVMEVINGRVTSSVKQPYEIYLQGELLFVLDTSGKISSLSESGAWAYMGTDHLAVYDDEERTRIRTFDFSTTDYVMFDPISTAQTMNMLYPFVFPIVLLISVAGLYAFRLLQILVVSAAALLLLHFRGRKAAFDALMGVAVWALVPSMVIETVLNMAHIYFPGRGWFLFFLIVGYMWRGVRAQLAGTEDEDGFADGRP
jgi:Protein of unknown function (DUF1189)